LSDSTKLVPCIDDTTAASLVAFIPQVLDKASSGSLSDLLALPALIKEFAASIPKSVGECLHWANNTDTAALLNAYGNPQSDPKIATKLIEYVTFHYSHVHKALK